MLPLLRPMAVSLENVIEEKQVLLSQHGKVAKHQNGEIMQNETVSFRARALRLCQAQPDGVLQRDLIQGLFRGCVRPIDN